MFVPKYALFSVCERILNGNLQEILSWEMKLYRIKWEFTGSFNNLWLWTEFNAILLNVIDFTAQLFMILVQKWNV